MEEREPSCAAGENVNWYSQYRKWCEDTFFPLFLYFSKVLFLLLKYKTQKIIQLCPRV